MAIALTARGSINSAADATSYATGSFTPSASVLLVAIYDSDRTSADPTTPAVAGHGTWTLVDSLLWNSDLTDHGKLFIFACVTGATPSASTVAFGHAGVTHHGAEASVFELSGTDVANGVAQTFIQFVHSSVNTDGGASQLSLTLAAAADTANRSFMALAAAGTSAHIPQTGWTAIHDVSHSTPSQNLYTEWRSDSADSAAFVDYTGLNRRGGIAFEVKATGTSGGGSGSIYGPALGAAAIRTGAGPRTVVQGTNGVPTGGTSFNTSTNIQTLIDGNATNTVFVTTTPGTYNNFRGIDATTKHPRFVFVGAASSYNITGSGTGDNIGLNSSAGLEVYGGTWKTYGNSSSASYVTPIHANGSSIVQDAVFTANGQTGLLFHGQGTVSHCTFSSNGRYGVNVGYGVNPVLEYCIIDSNNAAHFNTGGDAGGTKHVHNAGMICRYNWVKNNDGFGLWWDGYQYGIQCYDNVTEDNTCAGIFYEISYGGTVIERNYCRGDGLGNGQTPINGGFNNPFNNAGILVSCSPSDATGDPRSEDGSSGPNTTSEIRYNDIDVSGSVNGIALIDGNWHFEGKTRNWYVHHNRVYQRGASNQGRSGLYDPTNLNLITAGAANNLFNFDQYHVATSGGSYYECDGSKTLGTFRTAGHEASGTEDTNLVVPAPGAPITSLGVNAPHAVAFQTAIGKIVKWCRCYSQTQAWATGTTGWADAIAADARGQSVILSFKSSFTWAQVASGSDDARLTAIANGMMANTHRPGIIAFNHEPENDTPGTGNQPSDFKAASAHVRAVMSPLMTGWRFGPCLILDTFRTGSGRHPDDWVHTSNDVLLVDGYNWRDADTFGGGWADPSVVDHTPASIYGVDINAPNYAENLGMTFGFAEIGCSREEADTTGTERTAWWDSFADYTLSLASSKVEMVCHFEKNTSAVTAGDGGVVNWAIRNEFPSATQFARLLRDTAVTLPAGVTTVSGTTTWTDEHIVPAGATLRFDANNTTTLIMDNKNLVVYGELEMHPVSDSVIHTVRFINVNEQAYVGAPTPTYAGPNMGSMTASATDIGLWVLDHGILDAIGTARQGWNRTGDHSSWLSTDDMRTVPFNPLDYTTFATHTKGGPLLSVSPGNGVTYVQECFNLTRNVRFEGTPGHRAHVLIMTPGVTQVIKYARFEFLGPRHTNADGSTQIIRGRWSGVHFHHLMDSVGSMAVGCVVVNGSGHAYVTHDSHNVLLDDCIAYFTIDDAFWWDDEKALIDPNPITNPPPYTNSDYGFCQDQASHFVTYNHCMAARTFAAPGESAASMTGFNLLPGAFPFSVGGNTITDCVAVGNQGVSSAAGFTWPEAGSGTWINSGNVSHNNAGRGVYFWQNNDSGEGVTDLVSYRNGLGGITAGAYVNNSQYIDCVAFQNAGSGDLVTDFSAAAGGGAIVAPEWHQTIENCWFGDFGIIHHVADSNGSRVICRNNHLGSFRIDEWRPPGGANFRHSEWFFIENDLQEPEDFCSQSVHPHAGNHTWIYVINGVHPPPATESGGRDYTGTSIPSYFAVQRSDHTAFQMKQVGTSNTEWTAVDIPPIWYYITTTSLATATPGVAYSQPLGRIFGQFNYLPFTWRLKSGTLPTGLTIGAHPDGIQGLISGTTSATGSYPITVEIVNAHGDTSIPSDFTLVVGTGASLQITTPSLPAGFVGTSYSQTLVATGGSGAGKVWTLVSGTMPTGVGLSSAGVVSGTPTTIGNYTFTVRVTDNATNTTTKQFSILISALNPSITTTSPLPTGAVGAAYTTVTLDATGGAPPYTWSVVSGSVPAGLSMSAAGVITGTPTTPVVGSFTVRATDTAAHTNDKAFALTVVNGVSFLSTTASQGTTNVDYTTTFTAQNGVPPYVFSLGNNEPLPPGLSLSVDGVLSGVPTAPGTYVFQIIVEDSVGTTAQTDITLIITIRGFKVRRALALRGSSTYKPVA